MRDIFGTRRGLSLQRVARLVLDLADLQRECPPSRTWVTRAEWVRTCGRDKNWEDALSSAERWHASSARRSLERMRERLEELGLTLAIVTVDGENQIHANTPELRELVEPHVRRARVILECARARRAREAPDLSWLEEDPEPAAIADDYRAQKRQFRTLRSKYGVGYGRLKKTLASQRVEIREKRRMRISERVGPERTARALAVHDKGGSLEAVRRELGLATRWSARRFLERHGRDTKPANERQAPRPEPPVRTALVHDRACVRSATCA